MAKLSDLSDSLLRRFKDVPNVDKEDTDDWIERAMLEHGFSAESDVPQDTVLLVLLFAEWDGALQISLKTAFYFEYKDAEESVDKRSISEQFRRVASELEKKYQRKKAEGSSGLGGGPAFRIMTRADRP